VSNDVLQLVTPYAFTTEKRAQYFLDRDRTLSEREGALIVDAINWATAEMETFCNRALAARTYRNTTTLTGVISGTPATTFTVAAGAAALKPLDDVVGTAAAEGTRIASITSDTVLMLSRPGTAGAATLTFGSEPKARTAYGCGEYDLTLPEGPLLQVYAVNWVDPLTGARTAVDLTGAQVFPERWVLRLAAEPLPRAGTRLELEFKAGYLQPSATQLGHRAEWQALEHYTHRLIACYFQEGLFHWGRTVDAQAGGASARQPGWDIPSDIARGLARFKRRWG
jgi:hypothetical protein